MSDGSIGVPTTPPDVGQSPVDCEVMPTGKYRQRINAHVYYMQHGTTTPTPVQGADGCFFTMDYLTAIGSGYIAGHTPFHSIGYNADIASVREDICEWGGTYIPPPSAGMQMRLVSTSASDNGITHDTGVWSVEINYLDHLGIEQIETVVMNGTTPVDTVATDIRRVNYFHTATADIATTGEGHAAGNITLKNVAGTATYAQITADGNFSRHGFFTIPAGKKGRLTGAYVGAGGSTSGRFIRIMLRTTTSHDGVLTPGIFQFKRMCLAVDASIVVPFSIPINIPALTDIKFSAIDENGSQVSTYVEGFFEDA